MTRLAPLWPHLAPLALLVSTASCHLSVTLPSNLHPNHPIFIRSGGVTFGGFYGGFSDLLGPLAPGQTAKAPFTLRHAQGERGRMWNSIQEPFVLSPSKHETAYSSLPGFLSFTPVCALRQAQGEREKGSILPKNRLC